MLVRLLTLLSLLISPFVSDVFAADDELQPVALRGVRREPVAAAYDYDHPCLAIACAKSGTLLCWNLKQQQAEAEFKLGEELRGVVAIGLRQYLAIDSKRHELIRVQYADGQMKVLQRAPLPSHPQAICQWIRNDEIWVAVASLWSRQVSVWRASVERDKNDDWRQINDFARLQVIDLPFEPKLISHARPSSDEQADTLQIAAAFGGQMAQINLRTWQMQAWDQPIHNIGGLDAQTEGFDTSLVTHQTMNSKLPITAASLTSGELLQNRLSYITWGKQWHASRQLRLHKLGEQVDPFATTPRPLPPFLELKADPAGMAPLLGGLIVCLSGSNEVALFADHHLHFVRRIPVGLRPRAAIYLNAYQVIVLGELDDSLTMLDATKVRNSGKAHFEYDWDQLQVTTHWLDKSTATRELSPAERGERLFFSARMSAGGRMTCHSCHTDGHTNHMLADTLGDNTHGTPKRVLTLRGTRLTDLWAWNGEMKTLQDNVHKSLQESMHAPEIKPADVDDIVSFLHSLPPVPPLKPVPRDAADGAQVARGEKVFRREGCAICHVPPLTFTSHAVYDVGLADENGLKKFNPPSLRGVGRLRKLFHDNRASSLRDVFEVHAHQLAEPLPAEELNDLLRYLESL